MEEDRHTFASEAAIALSGRLPDAPEQPFWDVVSALGWGTASTDAAELARELRRRVTYVECLALHERLRTLSRDLGRAIERWEELGGGDRRRAPVRR